MLKIERVVAAAMAGVAVSGAAAQDAVQWRVEDGGNGHWYQLFVTVLRFHEAEYLAFQRGAHAVCLGEQGERDFIQAMAQSMFPATSSDAFYWLGGRRIGNSGCEWYWVNGEPYTGGISCSTSGTNAWKGSRLRVRWVGKAASITLQDMNIETTCTCELSGVLLEWSADCNGDGIVDYGQILDGTYADENSNGVPDCCESPCTGDLNLDNIVDSADLGLLIAAWNTDGSIVAGSDINGDGIVNAADLGLQIGNWGDCGCN